MDWLTEKEDYYRNEMQESSLLAERAKQVSMNIEKKFLTSQKPHVLMITNHGLHQWEIVPGLPDTGGQNVFVNQFTETLAKEGFRATIVNRGGYAHPVTGVMRDGLVYKDENQRILFLNDGLEEFVRKEDMDERIPYLVKALQDHINSEKIEIDLIISHYWDGAKIGVLFNQGLTRKKDHIWVPHSLGAVKKRNVKPELWGGLRIDERIEIEKELIDEVDGIAATSAIIRRSLKDDYGYKKPSLFLPPCVNPARLCPREIPENHAIWDFLSAHCGLTTDEIRSRKIITEISRTDSTKRKNILIKAFAEVKKKHKDTLLVVTIDENNKALYNELRVLIQELTLQKDVAVLGSVWEELPDIYAVTAIYCTPSVMEGFGMTPQEAAATRVPVVSSTLVPFAVEYLLGKNIKEVSYTFGEGTLKVGAGAIVVPPDDVAGFASALDILLSDDSLRKKMSEAAYQITIPYFTWQHTVRNFLKESGVKLVFNGDNG